MLVSSGGHKKAPPTAWREQQIYPFISLEVRSLGSRCFVEALGEGPSVPPLLPVALGNPGL